MTLWWCNQIQFPTDDLANAKGVPRNGLRGKAGKAGHCDVSHCSSGGSGSRCIVTQNPGSRP